MYATYTPSLLASSEHLAMMWRNAELNSVLSEIRQRWSCIWGCKTDGVSFISANDKVLISVDIVSGNVNFMLFLRLCN